MSTNPAPLRRAFVEIGSNTLLMVTPKTASDGETVIGFEVSTFTRSDFLQMESHDVEALLKAFGGTRNLW